MALSVLGALVLAATCAFYLVEPVYRSETKLVLKPDSETVSGLRGGGLMSEISAINTQIEVLNSHQMMRDLVLQLNLIEDPEFNPPAQPLLSISSVPTKKSDMLDATAENVAQAVTIRNVRNSYVLTVSTSSRNAEKSVKIANTLANIYVQKQIDAKQQDIAKSVDWLTQRIAALEQEIERQNTAAQAVNASIIAAEAEDFARRISDTETRLSTLSQEQNRLYQQSQTLRPDGLGAENNKTEPNDAIKREMDRTKRQVATLKNSLDQLKVEYSKKISALSRLQKIEHEARASELLLQTFLSRLKEITHRRGLQADSQIISFATTGTKIAPRPARMALVAGLAGSVLGIFIVFFRRYSRSSIPTAAQLEHATDSPVLGHLPQVPIRGRHRLVDYLADTPKSPLAEAARNLRTSLLMLQAHEPPKIVLVTSSVPDEGKTTTAIALAQNLAGLGRSVLLIEADIRRLSFQDYFDKNPNGGLVAALNENNLTSNLIQKDARIGVDILMGEHSARSAADLFASPEFNDLLQGLKDTYDHILIDSPPVLAVPDARVIGQSADAILLTVAPASTTREQVQRALREFSSVNLRVTGLVMSDLWNKNAANSSTYGVYSQYYAT